MSVTPPSEKTRDILYELSFHLHDALSCFLCAADEVIQQIKGVSTTSFKLLAQREICERKFPVNTPEG